MFLLILSIYLNDYPQIEDQCLAESAEEALEQMFTLLGSDISLEEKKRKPFAEMFELSGADLNLSTALTHKVVALNTAKPITELIQALIKSKLMAS